MTIADELVRRIQAFEGKAIGRPRVAPDPVNAPMIRHWCLALGDEDPIYRDDGAARAAGHPGIVAPPTMLQTWTMLDRREVPLPPYQMQEELRELLAAKGFTTVVATNCEQEYVRYLTVGERVTSRAILGSISPEKTTRFGQGHFVTTIFTYEDERGEAVGRMSFRCLLFRPREVDRAKTSEPVARRGALGEHGAPALPARGPRDAGVGDRLPDLSIPITPTLIIVGAISSMDFNTIHHDPDLARAAGSRDILMNILTTNGLVGRYVTDWAGPNARLDKVSLRLGAPNHPGDVMTMHGEVTAAESGPGTRRLQVGLTCVNGLGDHAVATVDLHDP